MKLCVFSQIAAKEITVAHVICNDIEQALLLLSSDGHDTAKFCFEAEYELDAMYSTPSIDFLLNLEW